MTSKQFYFLVILTLILPLSLKGQVFTDMQIPSTNGAQNFSLDFSWSIPNYEIKDDPYTETTTTSAFGLGLGYGISKSIDFKLRYNFSTSTNSYIPISENNIIFGPKISLIKNRLSIFAPFTVDNFKYPSKESYWSFQPRLLVGFPIVGDNFQLNAGLGYYSFFSSDVNGYFTWNLGIGLSINPKAWMIKMDYHKGTSSDQRIRTFSVGMIGFIAKKK